MALDLEDILACHRCGGVLPGLGTWAPSGVQCAACGQWIPLVRGIPRFVDSDDYAGSFSFEWTRHQRTQLDGAVARESEDTFCLKTGLSADAVAGRRVLDVGCGMGRFADVVSRWGGQVVGVDLSLAVEAAHANLGNRENVCIVQADVFRLPFRSETFDIVYSLGVLHHTPDCAAAFRSLVRFVKPGGTLAIWVYSHMGPWATVASFYRRLTTRLPYRVLHLLCYLAVPLYYVHRIPGIGTLSRAGLPTSLHPRASWRVLDTFDWYSPAYQSLHSIEEVRGWFEAAGLSDIHVLGFPVAIRGRKPDRSGQAGGQR